MSVGQDLVGKVFPVGQYSTGTVASETSDPIQYTEQNAAPGSQYGASTITVTGVSTNNSGVTTIQAQVATNLGNFAASGRLIGNDTSDFLIYGTISAPTGPVSAYFLFTNEPPTSGSPSVVSSPSAGIHSEAVATAASTTSSSGQPGVGNVALVRPESANISYDPNAGTVCFVSGTSIKTARGYVKVEDLAVGDEVVTASGARREIVWLGHRDISCRTPSSQPVCVAAHALGPNVPARDVWLSPGHPVLVGADEDGEGGHLVPIMCLLNGTTIKSVSVDATTYWHVELTQHDILLADGLPAESYLDWGDRAFFTEGADHALANPDFVVPGLVDRCRPVALDGPVVEAERRRIDAVFASRIAAAAAWPTCQTALSLA